MNILVVDDELVSRKKMEKIMQNVGSIKAVESGEEAIEACEKSHKFGGTYDLITLDVEMPGKDGMEVLLEIRDLEKQYQVSKAQRSKVLMVTSHAEKKTVLTCIQAECDDYVVKPFDRETLFKKMKQLGLKPSPRSENQ